MSIWQRIKRGFGVSDPRHWQEPGFLRLRLARDYGARLAFASGIGLGVGGLSSGILIAVAPPGELATGVLLGCLMFLVGTQIAFLSKDLAQVTVTLEDSRIRRRTKPFLFNPLHLRHRDEFWNYADISSCGIVPASALGTNYSLLVIAASGRMHALGVRARVDLQQTTAFLAEQGVRVQTLKSLPTQSRPGTSIQRRGFMVAAIMASVGVLLTVGGAAGRLVIHGSGSVMDLAAASRAMSNIPTGVAIREFSGLGDKGTTRCRVSPDGKWIWAVDAATRRHLVWSETQEAPVGELTVPDVPKPHATFTPDSRQIVVAVESEAQVWQLEPLENIANISLEEAPDVLVVSGDGTWLLAISMTAIRVYDLKTGQPVKSIPVTVGAVVTATLAADGKSVVVVQQPRILKVRLADGTVEKVMDFPNPNPVYFFGSLSAGGSWAAMQSPQGVDVFDLAQRQKRTTIPAGFVTQVSCMTSDGALLAANYLEGVVVWDIAAGKPIARFAAPLSTQLDLSANGRRLIGSATGPSKLSMWEMP